MNTTEKRRKKTLKKHASVQKARTPYSEEKHLVLSEDNLFPEALTLLGSFGQLSGVLGHTASADPEQLSQLILNRIEHHCKNLSPGTLALVEGVLSDFGEFLLMNGIQEKTDWRNERAIILLKQLLQTKSQHQLLQNLLEIKQFC